VHCQWQLVLEEEEERKKKKHMNAITKPNMILHMFWLDKIPWDHIDQDTFLYILQTEHKWLQACPWSCSITQF